MLAVRIAAADPHDDAPLLELDPTTMPMPLKGLNAAHDDDRAQLRLTPNVIVDRDAQIWSDTASDAVGWQIQMRLAWELGGGLTLDLDAGGGAVASRFGSGTYTEAGVGLTKLFHVSNGTTAWISLGASVRAWAAAPTATAFMLRAGFTFW